MAIESAGYTGTVTQEDWAQMAQFAGVDTAVADMGDLTVTAVEGVRLLSVSPGVAWGWGVLDTLTGTNTVTLSANGSGAVRWDAVVLRRNWATGATTLAVVTGTSTEAVPALTITPGVQADQVIALVAVAAGASSLVGTTIRRRVQYSTQQTTGIYPPVSPSAGQRWCDWFSGRVLRWDGAAWVDSSSAPIGAIMAFGGPTAPDGWHLCDGSLHGSASLQAVIGSTRTPDLRDRFIVGAGSSYARGDTGGAATVALSVAQLPAHTHTVSVREGTADAGDGTWVDTAPAGTSTLRDVGVTGATGSGSPVENRPPFHALVYIIRKG